MPCHYLAMVKHNIEMLFYISFTENIKLKSENMIQYLLEVRWNLMHFRFSALDLPTHGYILR